MRTDTGEYIVTSRYHLLESLSLSNYYGYYAWTATSDAFIYNIGDALRGSIRESITETLWGLDSLGKGKITHES